MYPPGQFAEHLLHQDPNVTVTSARFIVNGTTYPIRGLTAVQYVEVPADYGNSAKLLVGGIIFGIFGAVFGGGSAALIGGTVVGFALAVLTAVGQKPTYVIRVMTAAGQTDAFASHDKARCGAIAAALNRAVAGG